MEDVAYIFYNYLFREINFLLKYQYLLNKCPNDANIVGCQGSNHLPGIEKILQHLYPQHQISAHFPHHFDIKEDENKKIMVQSAVHQMPFSLDLKKDRLEKIFHHAIDKLVDAKDNVPDCEYLHLAKGVISQAIKDGFDIKDFLERTAAIKLSADQTKMVKLYQDFHKDISLADLTPPKDNKRCPSPRHLYSTTCDKQQQRNRYYSACKEDKTPLRMRRSVIDFLNCKNNVSYPTKSSG